jgi:hypothetical protein
MNRVQKMRKAAAVSYEDKVAVYYKPSGMIERSVKLAHSSPHHLTHPLSPLSGDIPKVSDALVHLADFIHQGLRIDLIQCDGDSVPAHVQTILSEETEVEEEKLTLHLVRLA